MTELELQPEPRAPAYIGSVRLNGAEVDLDRVLASVIIRHGRDSVDGGIQSSTASLVLRNLSRAELADWEVGGDLQISDLAGAPLFTGRLSDSELDDDAANLEATLAANASSTLARAGSREVGGHAWPAEPWAARMARILSEAGLTGVVQPRSPDVPIAATVPDEGGGFSSTNALDALDASRNDVGATVFDDVDGSIVCQAYEGRLELYPLLSLDPDLVLFSPPWSQTLDVANRIVLGYGYGAGSVTVDDSASQAKFGVHWTGLFDSGLADSATALSRASFWLTRLSWPRWALPGVTLLEPQPLQIGMMVELVDLPDSAPFGNWTAMVEGWVDTIEGSSWTQDLILSDPLLSGLSLLWRDVPATLHWLEVNPACEWRDAFNLGNLLPETRLTLA